MSVEPPRGTITLHIPRSQPLNLVRDDWPTPEAQALEGGLAGQGLPVRVFDWEGERRFPRVRRRQYDVRLDHPSAAADVLTAVIGILERGRGHSDFGFDVEITVHVSHEGRRQCAWGIARPTVPEMVA